MNAVTKTEPAGGPVTVADYGASLMEVIASAARDPSVDIDKMERLIAMQERVQSRQAELAFNKALNTCQSDMRPISANASNPQTKSRYATFDKLDRVLRPIYTEQGFSLSFDEGETDKPDYVRVLCYVSHVEGHTRTYHRDMPADGKGAKGGDVMTKTHAAGAAGSYGARYLLKGIFNVAVGEDDDDGNVTVTPEKMPDAEWAKLVAMIEATHADTGKMLTVYGVKDLSFLSEAQYADAIAALEKKMAKMAAAHTQAQAEKANA